MILILAHHYDAEAEWLSAILRQQHQPAVLLWPEAVGVDYCISLLLTANGEHAGRVSFCHSSPVTFATDAIHYAFNRLGYVLPLVWERATPIEKSYATSEINAFFSAFVKCLSCPVSNPVQNGALWRGSGFEAKWLARLHRHGVAVHPTATANGAGAINTVSSSDRTKIRRWLHYDGELFSPPGQARSYPELEQAILDEHPDEMLEFVAIEDGLVPRYRMLWVTKTPALSCYGDNVVAAVLRRADAGR